MSLVGFPHQKNAWKKGNFLRCPECGSQRIWKDGIRYNTSGKIQRYLCRECSYRFSEPNVKINISTQSSELLHSGANLTEQMVGSRKTAFKKSLDSSLLLRSENVRSQSSKPQHITSTGKDLNAFLHYNSDCQVCVNEKKMKNLVKVETRQKQAAGATGKSTKAEVKGRIIEFAWKLKKEGYSESTIKTYTSAMEILDRKGADIFDPENVKDIISKQKWNNTSKFNYVNFYDAFTRTFGIHWKKPRYKPIQKLPFIPLEKHIDQLIYSAGKKMGTVLQLIKETGIRIGEVLQLEWGNIDSNKNLIMLNNPEKRGNPRVFKTSSELMSRIKALPKKSDRVFGNASRNSYESQFLKLRKRLTRQLNDSTFLRITLHTIRHWKATMLYHQTKDILYVMKFLGHKNIKNTLIYTQLIEFGAEEEYHVKVAKTLKEACELAKAGFEYFTEIEEAQVFRKRK
jgi:Site-specific recombinase XerD